MVTRDTTTSHSGPRNRHERPADAIRPYDADPVVDRVLRRILRPAAAADALGVSRMTLYRLEAAGKIPPRVRVSDHCVGWYADDLATYLASRQTVRETGPCRAPTMAQ